MRKLFLIYTSLLFVLTACTNRYTPPVQEVVYPTPEHTPVITPTPELPELSEERKSAIEESYLAWFVENFPIEQGGWEGVVYQRNLQGDEIIAIRYPEVAIYYGTFNGREVVMINDYVASNLNMPRETIADYIFEFSNGGWHFEHRADWINQHRPGGVHIWLHNDGDFMCICVGYERGYLTAEDIGVIWARHTGGV